MKHDICGHSTGLSIGMHFSRALFYKLPPWLRYLLRIVRYLPADLLDYRSRQQAMVPPRGMIFTGSGNFVKDGNKWLGIFKRYGLQNSHSFLDIGSGIGRIARPLTGFLVKEARYEGLDIIPMGVRWCKKHISSRYPHFRFTQVNLKNDLYRSSGGDASTMVFPYDQASFDFACATSVFTHMLPAEVSNYLHQCHRVLKPGGVLVATFFIQDKDIRPVTGVHLDFPHAHGHYALHSEDAKGANVRYDKDFLFETLQKTGFEQVDYQQGYWKGLPKVECMDFQDCLVLKKAF